MKENAIISLADSNYFELLNELVDSIKSFDQSKEIAICILDAGLQKDQIEVLKKKVDQIKSKLSENAIEEIANEIPPILEKNLINNRYFGDSNDWVF